MIGLAHWLGVGFQEQRILADSLGESLSSILANGMMAGGFAAILMTLAIDLAKPRRQRMSAKLDIESLPKIEDFPRQLGKDKRWRERLAKRTCAAAEESLLSLVPAEGRDGQAEIRHLLLIAGGSRSTAEL